MTRVVNVKTGEEIVMPEPPYIAVQKALCLSSLGNLRLCECFWLPVKDEGSRYRCGDWIAVKGTENVVT